jgi:uncharacterized protein
MLAASPPSRLFRQQGIIVSGAGAPRASALYQRMTRSNFGLACVNRLERRAAFHYPHQAGRAPLAILPRRYRDVGPHRVKPVHWVLEHEAHPLITAPPDWTTTFKRSDNMSPRIFRMLLVHQRLDTALRAEQARRSPDDLRIQRLKRLKLRVKDILHMVSIRPRPLVTA